MIDAMHGREWVIAIVGPNLDRYFVGNAHRANVRLLVPVYELRVGVVKTPQGEGVMHQAVPVLFLPSLSRDGLEMPESAMIFALASLSESDQQTIRRAIDGAERMVTAMTASQAGLVLADKIPAIKGL